MASLLGRQILYTPPAPANTFLRVALGGGGIKEGGAITILPRGGSKYTHPPPLSLQCLLAKRGEGGGHIRFLPGPLPFLALFRRQKQMSSRSPFTFQRMPPLWHRQDHLKGGVEETAHQCRRVVNLTNIGNGRNTVSRVLVRRRELTEFYGKLGEFCEKLGEFAFAHK